MHYKVQDYDVMAKRAIFAPPFFDELERFIKTRCMHHEDIRVSSEDKKYVSRA
jgi:hypothetical protein